MNPLIAVSESDQVAVAVLEGEIDLSCSRSLGRQIFQQMSGDVVGLVLDLSGVRYIDSSGIRMLFDMARQLADGRRYLAVAAPSDSSLRRLFEVTRIDDAAPLRESVDAAREAIRRLAAEVSDSP